MALTSSGSNSKTIPYEINNPGALPSATRNESWYPLASAVGPQAFHPSRGIFHLFDSAINSFGVQQKETFLVGPLESYNRGEVEVGFLPSN